MKTKRIVSYFNCANFTVFFRTTPYKFFYSIIDGAKMPILKRNYIYLAYFVTRSKFIKLITK